MIKCFSRAPARFNLVVSNEISGVTTRGLCVWSLLKHEPHSTFVECGFLRVLINHKETYMAIPVSKNITLYAGDNFSFVTTYKGSEDLVGATAEMQARITIDADEILLSLTGAIDTVEKTITYTFTPANTTATKHTTLGKSESFYDSQITFLNGVINTNQRGKLITLHDVTR